MAYTYRELVSQASMGDEAATDEIAARLHQLDDLVDQQEKLKEQSPAEAQYRQALGKVQFERHLRAVARADGLEHVLSDPEYLEQAKRVNERNRASPRYQNVDDVTVARISLQQVADRLGPPEERGNQEYIQSMRKHRAQSAFDRDEDDSLPDLETAEIEAEHAAAIALMAEARKPREGPGPLPERQKPKRMTPWPER